MVENICRFIFEKFVKTCCELDLSLFCFLASSSLLISAWRRVSCKDWILSSFFLTNSASISFLKCGSCHFDMAGNDKFMWSACHKKSYLTNLEVRNLKSEISCLCPVWLSQFCLFWKKMGKGFVNIPKFVNSTHNKYLFLWHADHIRVFIYSSLQHTKTEFVLISTIFGLHQNSNSLYKKPNKT